MVTDEQVRLLRQKRMDGKSQESAAAAAGMSVRTARKWESAGALPSASAVSRSWRTRPDPFVGVWDEEIVPLLVRDEERILQATTLLDLLEDGSGRVREYTASALGEIASDVAVPKLRQALNDEEAGVRQAAAWALQQIENRQIGKAP